MDGVEGEDRERLQAALDLSLRMNPLTPDHHFYIDQGTNARLRIIAVAIGRKLVEAGLLDDPEDVIYLKYNELRVFMANPDSIDARSLVSDRRDEREHAYTIRPREWVGTATQTALDFPYNALWGFPEKFYREAPKTTGDLQGLAASPGIAEGTARYVGSLDDFDQVQKGEILVCQMTNPAWVVLFTKIAGLVTDAGGAVSHPAVVAREFGIPAVVGTSERDGADQDRGSRAGQRSHRSRRDPGVTARADGSPRAGQGCAPRAHPRGRVRAGRPPRRDPDRARARHEPGARAGGAARARRPAVRRVGALSQRPRPDRLGARARRGLPGASSARGAGRFRGSRPHATETSRSSRPSSRRCGRRPGPESCDARSHTTSRSTGRSSQRPATGSCSTSGAAFTSRRGRP